MPWRTKFLEHLELKSYRRSEQKWKSRIILNPPLAAPTWIILLWALADIHKNVDWAAARCCPRVAQKILHQELLSIPNSPNRKDFSTKSSAWKTFKNSPVPVRGQKTSCNLENWSRKLFRRRTELPERTNYKWIETFGRNDSIRYREIYPCQVEIFKKLFPDTFRPESCKTAQNSEKYTEKSSEILTEKFWNTFWNTKHKFSTPSPTPKKTYEIGAGVQKENMVSRRLRLR